MVSWKDLVEEALDPKIKSKGSTLVVQNHLAQMKMFVVRGGIELYPVQDTPNQIRKKFIDDFFKFNKIPGKLDRLCDIFNAKGEVLMFFRPTKNGRYKWHLYEKEQFKVYYDLDGDMNKVVIIYSFEHEDDQNNYSLASINKTRWIRMTITADKIIHEFFTSKPKFKGNAYGGLASAAGNSKQEYVNSLKFIPCVVCKNYVFDEGGEGLSDFFPVRSQLENLDRAVRDINTNLKFFGSSTLVTSRTRKEMLRATENDPKSRDSISSRSGYSSTGWSSFGSNPTIPSFPGFDDEEMAIARIFENVSPDDRFGYISPDAVTPDHAQHVRELREQIHFALGGIDELGISANATAYEMKAIYGKVSTTASKKAMMLYDYGLCLVLEMIIAAEEDLFRQSLALAIGKDQSEVTDQLIAELDEQGKIPAEGVFGLMPVGDRRIQWRYTGEVFEKSARDKMEESIVVRNLQELGMSAVDALKITRLFEDKTNQEIEAILSEGYPYRYVQSVLGTTQQAAGLYGQLMQLPDFQNANGQAPLGLTFPIAQLINRGVETIGKELSYQKKYDEVDPIDLPQYQLGLSNFNQYQEQQYANTNSGTAPTDPTTANGYAASPSGYAAGLVQPSWGNGSPNGGNLGIPEYAANVPEPNAVVSTGFEPNRSTGIGKPVSELFGPVSAGYFPASYGNAIGVPTMEPIPDNAANADRRTRKPANRRTKK
jgi:hypothetical protein